jgi:hypothetical protein
VQGGFLGRAAAGRKTRFRRGSAYTRGKKRVFGDIPGSTGVNCMNSEEIQKFDGECMRGFKFHDIFVGNNEKGLVVGKYSNKL